MKLRENKWFWLWPSLELAVAAAGVIWGMATPWTDGYGVLNLLAVGFIAGAGTVVSLVAAFVLNRAGLIAYCLASTMVLLLSLPFWPAWD